MATIREVARHAGVSIGTVSKVLNGSDERVDPEAKLRILASIRTLRYKPPPFEKNQRASVSNNLAMIVPDLFEHPLLRHGYAHRILDGVLERSAFRGWSVTIFAATMWDNVGNAVRRKYDGRCDAVIVAAPRVTDDIVPSLHRRGAPVVQIGTTAWLDDISSIDIDNYEAGRVIAEHFVSLGHQKLAFVAHHQDQMSSQERFAGFRSVAGEDTPRFVVQRDNGAERVVREMMDMGQNRPTALLGWHDGLAIELISEFKKVGMEAPRDISIAGVDDAWDSADKGIQLTTVDNPLHEIGMLAASMAIDRVLDHSITSEIIKLPVKLIARSTTGPVPK